MGVPAFYRWLSTKYSKIISPVVEQQPEDVDGHEVPVNMANKNPNGEEFDNLYLDMNGIVHPCSHPEDRPPPTTEAEMMLEVFKYTTRVVNMVRPRKLLMIAVDGVAPRAKMNQQRARRFRSAQEAKEKDEDKAEFLKLIRSQKGEEAHEEAMATLTKKTWDSNAITPGTPFMSILAASLRYWCAYQVNTTPGWEHLKIVISDATVPGEGEHKIMEFVRSQRSSPEYDPNTRHVIYGLDADLIMLGLATHEPHFWVLREDVFHQESKARTCRLCGQKGHIAEACQGKAKQIDGEHDEKDKAMPLKPFIWLNVAVLREYLAAELEVPDQPFRFDVERALDDWVFLCFFVGNDFLPHLPSLDIKEDGIDTLTAVWRSCVPHIGGYVTKDGDIDFRRLQHILDGLAKQEDAIFKSRKEIQDRRDANHKRRKLEEQNRNNPKDRQTSAEFSNPTRQSFGNKEHTLTYEMVMNRGLISRANDANKSAAAALKSQLLGQSTDSSSAPKTEPSDESGSIAIKEEPDSGQNGTDSSSTRLGKRKADVLEDEDNATPGRNTPRPPEETKIDPDEPPPDNVRLWEDGYADRYYEQKFKVDPQDLAFRNQVARAYVEGLSWVLRYYLQGCPSWTWYYPYHYAPFAADFVDIKHVEVHFDKGIPFKPFEQLMGVMPAASGHTLPEIFRPLMSNADSPIIDFYPVDFPVDLNGKKFAWQGVALLPFIDESRLLEAMAEKYPLLPEEEAARNGVGKDVLIMSDKHPLYAALVDTFYSKRQNSSSLKLDVKKSKGLAGMVEKNDDYLPHSALVFPLPEGGMPDLDEDHSISVHYDMPRSTNRHKSMLLRGAKLRPPELTQYEVDEVRHRAQHPGKPHNGNSYRGNRGGRGRGGYAGLGDRPNPFAQHLNPGFDPSRGPPPPQQNGWAPPPQNHGPYGNGGYGDHGYPQHRPPPQSYGYGAPPQSNGYYQGHPPPPQQNFYGGPPPSHGGPYGNGGYNHSYQPPPSYNGGPPPGSYNSGHQGPPPGNYYDPRGRGGSYYR